MLTFGWTNLHRLLTRILSILRHLSALYLTNGTSFWTLTCVQGGLRSLPLNSLTQLWMKNEIRKMKQKSKLNLFVLKSSWWQCFKFSLTPWHILIKLLHANKRLLNYFLLSENELNTNLKQFCLITFCAESALWTRLSHQTETQCLMKAAHNQCKTHLCRSHLPSLDIQGWC